MNFKETRKHFIVLINTVEKIEKSREMSLVKTKLQEGMAWCGKALQYSENSVTPYTNDGNRKEVKDIEPLFDPTDISLLDKYGKTENHNHIFYVDKMREHLGGMSSRLKSFMNKSILENGLDELEPDNETVFSICEVNIFTKITEARFWLGFELGRLRDAEVKS